MKAFIVLAFSLLLGSTGLKASAAGSGSPAESAVGPDRLQVAITVAPDGDIVARQNVKVTIETATRGWFAGGTRIAIPEVAGLVILQNEKFAANASERRNGDTWVVQRWSLDVYPLRAGTFTIPPIALKLKLTSPDNQPVSAAAATPPVAFTASVPPALNNVRDWVASENFTAVSRFDRAPEGLSVGDAIQQTVTFAASDIMAMMLPTFEPPQLAGLAAYPEPPALSNRINRGQNTATRSVTISYLIEQPGDFVLPAHDYFWWDTKNARLEVVTLPATTLAAGGTVIEPGKAASGFSESAFWGVAGLLVCSAALLVLLRSRPWKKGRGVLIKRIRTLLKPALPHKLNP